jgi:hypothetical protein
MIIMSGANPVILKQFNHNFGPCRLVVRSSRCGSYKAVKTEARILAGTFFCLLIHDVQVSIDSLIYRLSMGGFI